MPDRTHGDQIVILAQPEAIFNLPAIKAGLNYLSQKNRRSILHGYEQEPVAAFGCLCPLWHTPAGLDCEADRLLRHLEL